MTREPTALPRGNLDFTEFAAREDEDLDLLTGALLIARDARPSLDFAGVEAKLDALSSPLEALSLERLSDQAEALALELSERYGLSGNKADYYDPDNSFIDQVLERRVGIPISLSLVYVEVAQRAGFRASGIGFPGHFLVRLDGEAEHLILDPFAGGRVLDQRDLEARLDQVGWPRKVLQQGLLDPSPLRLILARMLTNLRSIYLKRGELPRLLVVLDRLVALIPASKEALRDRGILNAELGAPEAARADLNEYLERWPNADDGEAVRRVLNRLGKLNTRDLN
ncbi:MAG: tetratricopeptide repeat protein [Polyangiaceae bacterium]|nr:tetratricopeptide repeat protein [Myxococcales bacterium]MCB9590316.1 tetratricopeptide repeat protein [Polyangiaceae bacterium]MCB9605029.1 tetratricopeptide repeat protein [Polyangiaceae bacterium]